MFDNIFWICWACLRDRYYRPVVALRTVQRCLITFSESVELAWEIGITDLLSHCLPPCFVVCFLWPPTLVFKSLSHTIWTHLATGLVICQMPFGSSVLFAVRCDCSEESTCVAAGGFWISQTCLKEINSWSCLGRNLKSKKSETLETVWMLDCQDWWLG